MNNPQVSILIPCYNVEEYLPKCLDTVLGQTYSNLQVVLIDDGSKDGTWTVMKEYASKDARIEIYHQENQGVAATRNHLLEKIKGDYVLFVDSDDWIELDMVERMITLAMKYNSPFIMCDRVINDAKPRTTPEIIRTLSQEEAVHDFLRHEYFIGSLWNKLIKTSLLHNIQFHCGISYGEDALFCWYVLQNTPTVIVTDRQFYHYRMNEGSISHASYDERKMSGHIVWETLAKETKERWPQYVYIAEANYAISDMWQIYYARQSNYPKDENIRFFQHNVRSHLPMIYRSGLINWKKMIFATVAAYCYNVCKLFVIK